MTACVLPRIAVAGAGYIGRQHIAILQSGAAGCTLAGACDPFPDARALAGKRGATAYASLDELIERERPDGLIVATPNREHAAGALAAISAGIPVLVEKPLSDSLSEARELVEAAERASVSLLTGHHRRHNPILRRAAQLLEDGAVGRIVAVSGRFLLRKHDGYHDVAWRREPGGGPLAINASHDIDCLRMLCGDIVSVHGAVSSAARGLAVEDTAAALLQFSSGALGTLLCSDAVAAPWSWEMGSRENPQYAYTAQDCYLIAGTEGSLSLPSLRLFRPLAAPGSWNEPLSETLHAVPHADSLTRQLANFAAVIRGESMPVVSGREGLLTLATVAAIRRAAETGSRAIVEDFVAGGENR